MHEIFISYRRDDSDFATIGMYDQLTASLVGRKNPIFKDVNEIKPGEHFPTVLSEALGSCVVALVVIGAHWLEAKDKQGHRRLDDPDDFVRIEIETLLSRTNIHVIPVLLNGIEMSSLAGLPESIAPITKLQSVVVRSGSSFHSDIDEVFAHIRPYVFGTLKPAEYGGIVGIARKVRTEESHNSLISRILGNPPASKILSFLLDEYDQGGNRVRSMNVEMRGSSIENLTYLSDDDEVEVHVRKQRNGIFRSRLLHNRTREVQLKAREVILWSLALLPENHPGWSVLITSLFSGLFLFIGVSLVGAAFTTHHVDSVSLASMSAVTTGATLPMLIGGGITCAVGAVLSVLVINAMLKTQGLRNWQVSETGALGHPIVRWLGPITLFVTFSLVVVLLWVRRITGGSQSQN